MRASYNDEEYDDPLHLELYLFMDDEFALFNQAVELSENMLKALSQGDIEALLKIAEQRETKLNEIHQSLAAKTSLPADQVDLLRGLIEINNQLVDIVGQTKVAVGEELRTIKTGNKARDAYE